MIGALDKEQYQYINRLNTAQKKSLLGSMKTILGGNEDEETRITQYNIELEEADAAIEGGAYFSNEEVFENTKKMIVERKNGKVV